MSERAPLLPVKGSNLLNDKALHPESNNKLYMISFLWLVLSLEALFATVYYVFVEKYSILFDLMVASWIKLLCSLLAVYILPWILGIVLSIGIYTSFLVMLCNGAYRMDNFLSNEPFSNLHVTIPLLLTALEFYILQRVSKVNKGDFSEKKSALTLRTVLLLMKPYFWPNGMGNRGRALSTFFLLGVSKSANLLSPLYMGKATNALVTQDLAYARDCLAIYCSFVLLSKVFKEMQSVVYLRVKQTAYIQIAEMTYRHLHSLSLEWHLKKRMGDVLRSMDRGVESANQVVSYLFLYLLPTVLEAVIVLFIFALHFDLALLAMIGFFGLLCYSIVTINITLWRKKFREATNKHDNEFHDRATDSLINFETVKYFTNENFEVKVFTDAVRKYQTHSTWTQASLSILNSSQAIIIQATIFGALAISVPHVMNHDHAMDVGGFVAISVYLMNLFAPLSFLGTIYNMMIKAAVDIEKLAELLNVEPDLQDKPDASILKVPDTCSAGVSVEFKNVFFHYPTQNPSSGLQDVSFYVAPNTTSALVGKTGSGKTTISRLLFRFYDVLEGQILVNNQNVADVKQISLRNSIGIVPQDTVLFNDTILYNVKYGKLNATMEEVEKCAKEAQIFDYIMSLPEKWNSKVGERGLKLSGGEKQRLAIARTLLKNPPLVILDEATSALDTITEAEIQKALSRLHENRTMIVIAHRLSTIRKADQILLLKHGKVVERGTHDSLVLQENSEYKKLWNMQRESRE